MLNKTNSLTLSGALFQPYVRQEQKSKGKSHTSLQNIIQGCWAKRQDSQKLFYERFYGRMLGLCRRYALGEAEAQELVQNNFLLLFQNPRMLSFNLDEKKLSRIFLENMISSVRKDQLFKKMPKRAQPGMDVKAENTYECLINVLRTLSPLNRFVYNLHVVEEFSTKKVAQMLHISIKEVSQALKETRRVLHKALPTQ